MQCFENFADLGIKIPYPGFGEMRVSGFKKSVAVKLANAGRDSSKDLRNEFAPPLLVVIFARAIDRPPRWHLFPASREGAIERGGIKPQADACADERIMMPDTFLQVNQRAGCVEKDGLKHPGFVCADSRILTLFAFHVQTGILLDSDVGSINGMKAIDELFAAPEWTQSRREEIANSISHGLGLAAAVMATPFLCVAAARQGNSAFLVGTIIFVSTMWLLYLCSTLYHAWPQTRLKCALQIIDHSAIFLLIAGTYSPFTLGPLRGAWGWTMFALVWLLAAIGVIMKLRTGVRWKKLSMMLYLGMGWLVLIVFWPVVVAIPWSALVWLFAGGIAYTSGLIFFGNERTRYSHFVWHLFVLAGTACHFCAIYSCAA